MISFRVYLQPLPAGLCVAQWVSREIQIIVDLNGQSNALTSSYRASFATPALRYVPSSVNQSLFYLYKKNRSFRFISSHTTRSMVSQGHSNEIIPDRKTIPCGLYKVHSNSPFKFSNTSKERR